MIFPMHVGDRVCPWSLFHCQGNFSVFCSFIRMLQLEETLLCKQCAECVVCLWLCCVAAVPNVHNLCVFIPPIVSRFWLFVAPICDLWRWMERSTMILQRHLVSFFLFFYAKAVRMLSWTIRSSTLATKGWWRVWYPVYFFHAELIVFCLLFYFEVIRCLNIVVPLGGVHSWFAATTLFQAQWNSCIRWWIHFFQILFHGGLPGRSMILERDEGSDGWIAFEGIYDSVKYEFDRLRVCFKCPDVGALDDGSFQGWFVNRAADGAEPDWGTATMRCLSHWEREWTVLLFFFCL